MCRLKVTCSVKWHQRVGSQRLFFRAPPSASSYTALYQQWRQKVIYCLPHRHKAIICPSFLLQRHPLSGPQAHSTPSTLAPAPQKRQVHSRPDRAVRAAWVLPVLQQPHPSRSPFQSLSLAFWTNLTPHYFRSLYPAWFFSLAFIIVGHIKCLFESFLFAPLPFTLRMGALWGVMGKDCFVLTVSLIPRQGLPHSKHAISICEN